MCVLLYDHITVNVVSAFFPDNKNMTAEKNRGVMVSLLIQSTRGAFAEALKGIAAMSRRRIGGGSVANNINVPFK